MHSSQAIAFAALLGCGAATAGEAPLPLYNQGALARAFELPVLGYARVLDHDESLSSIRYDLTSEFHASQDADESVTLDGEAQMLTLAFRRGYGSGLEWTFELPLLYQSGGFTDGFIEGWHDAFGLPDGGRPEAPRDRYLYQYTRDGQVLLDQRETGTDLGDLRLGLGWQAAGWVALRGELKVASGDEEKLAGGNYGGAVWLDAALPFAERSVWSGWLSAGASYNGTAGLLEDQQQQFVPFGGAGLSLRAFERVFVLAQVYAHGPLYDDSDLDPFRAALQLALGLRWRVTQDFDVDIAFQEDPITSSSPDFSGHLGLTWR